MFGQWDDAKYEKYGIDKETYDHHDVGNRPTVLIRNYHNHRYPYPIMIYLWDESKSFLLSSRYDPLKSGKGEARLPREDDSTRMVSSSSSSRRSRRLPQKEKNYSNSSNIIKKTMRQWMTMLAKNNAAPANVKQIKDVTQDSGSACAKNWYDVYDKHVSHMKFLKENDLFVGKRKSDVLENIDSSFVEITRESSANKTGDNDCELEANSNSNLT